MGYEDFLSYFSIIATFYSFPMNEDTRQRILNLGSNIKENILWALFFKFFFKKERKDFSTTQTPFLMLEAKKVNSSTIIDSSSIKFNKDGKTSGTFLSFKIIDIVEFNTLFSN
jgi:hypothetical protein